MAKHLTEVTISLVWRDGADDTSWFCALDSCCQGQEVKSEGSFRRSSGSSEGLLWCIESALGALATAIISHGRSGTGTFSEQLMQLVDQLEQLELSERAAEGE